MAPKQHAGLDRSVVPGGVDEYIEKMPEDARVRLREIRSAIQAAAPRSTETVSYFEMPGYFYAGYDYNGMFAWFSFKPPFVRLHVRPPVLEDHKKDLGDYPTTKAIISFPVDEAIPKALVKKLVKASSLTCDPALHPRSPKNHPHGQGHHQAIQFTRLVARQTPQGGRAFAGFHLCRRADHDERELLRRLVCRIHIRGRRRRDPGESRPLRRPAGTGFGENQRGPTRFLCPIAGPWWEHITPNDNSALSFVTIEADPATGTIKLHGRGFGLDGEPLSRWETIAVCVKLSDKKVFYYWEGKFPKKATTSYEGFGQISFHTSGDKIDDADGFFSDTNLENWSTTTRKLVTFRRCPPQEAKIMSGDDSDARSKLLQAKIKSAG